MQQFVAASTIYPPSRNWDRKVDDNGEAWSAQAKILPFISENTDFKNIEFRNRSREVKFADGTLIDRVRIATYICPDELHDTAMLVNRKLVAYPHNYGFNMGPWLVYDPAIDKGGQGCFYPNARLRPVDITDGLSMTLMAAEVKAFTPYVRGAGAASVPPIPTPWAVCQMRGTAEVGPDFMDNPGHTDWSEGTVDQTGFTTTFAPNTIVTRPGKTRLYDIDFNNMSEGGSMTAPTFAAVTSRSYHIRIVNTALMDGSTRTIADNIDLSVWRALSTRNGHENVTASF